MCAITYYIVSKNEQQPQKPNNQVWIPVYALVGAMLL